jgi:hypothetical protein
MPVRDCGGLTRMKVRNTFIEWGEGAKQRPMKGGDRPAWLCREGQCDFNISLCEI